MYYKDKEKVICVRLTKEQFEFLESIEKECYTKKSIFVRNLIDQQMKGVKEDGNK